ncbi:hypothetical protein EDD36DRAFT_104211 [Exophiala viscosa]|uniref:Zn(2)-C6 fungal-type domain-containing protein n=1 Tax=Exophiala viscosa TaxID=2486360 RepID=A0AAN6DNG3_9EURO|nr:hypothetical protein EDD36DRAFT_104211 [Exophiala viscosa]
MTPRTPVPRKKSCNNCSKAKVRCDLGRPACTRCKKRGGYCEYVDAKDSEQEVSSSTTQDEYNSIDGSTSVLNQAQYNAVPLMLGTVLSTPAPAEILDFENVQLVRTVDDYRIRARWLESVLPSAHQTPKDFAPTTMAFVSDVFKSYPGIFLAENSLPPFIHWAQVSGKMCEALANCMNLARMWETQAGGTEAMVCGIIEKEMARLFQQETHCSDLELLATLQAYLLLTIMLFFTSRSGTNFIEQDTIIRLQELAGDVANKGTLCLAETNGARPDWESWIIASAKRRTLFATYLFDNLVSFTLGSPSFIATELASLPAPASKRLWNAQTRLSWNATYNQQLSQCADGELLISHLWPSPDSGTPEQQRKVRRWLSSVDEFGIMLYSVTSHTYGKQA